MEAKLQEFRARKYKNNLPDNKNIDIRTLRATVNKPVVEEKACDEATPTDKPTPTDASPVPQETNELPPRSWQFIGIQFLVWFVLWIVFIKFEVGAIYFICSIPVYIYKNLGPTRNPAAPSAYSVFNKDCERIGGTFTAEQFEKQLRRGTLT